MKKNQFNLYLSMIILFAMVSSRCEDEKFPPSSYEIGQITLACSYDLYVENDYAYVTHNHGMGIIDIGMVSDPNQVASNITNKGSFGILVENGIAYLGSADGNLSLIDVDDRSNPIILSELEIPGAIYSICRKDTVLFLSTWSGYLHIINITDNDSPEVITSYDCQGNGTNLAYHNDVIYYANAQKGLQIIDVSDLNSPSVISAASHSSAAWDIKIKDGFLYLGRHGSGFTIYEIDEDNSLTYISSRNNGGEVYGICQDGNELYIGDLQQGVEVWDISNKGNPTLVQTIDEYAPHDIEVHNGYIYLADQDSNDVFELYTSTPDGTDNDKVSVIPVAGGDVWEFGWAPNSTRIAYIADQDTDDVLELYTSPPDSSIGNAKVSFDPLVSGGSVATFEWSPDSTRIAYRADQDTDDVIEIYTSPPDSNIGNVKVSFLDPITIPGSDVFDYSWAPDSSRIAYIADQDSDNVFELYSSLPNGSVNDKVSGPLIPGGRVFSFKWAPDTSRIAYRADQNTDNVFELYSSLPDGSGNGNISGPIVLGGVVSAEFEYVP